MSGILFRKTLLVIFSYIVYKNKILIYYITKMGKYSCEKCAKTFSQKSHYTTINT